MALTLEEAYYNNIVKGLNAQLANTIIWLGSEEAQRFFNERTENIHSFWKTSKMREEWDELTRTNAKNSQEYIEQIYEAGAKYGYNQLNRIIGYTKADRETLYHLKKYNYNLIKDVNQEAIQNIRKTLTFAEAEGLHPFETAKLLQNEGLDGIGGLSPLQRARMIARTESKRANTAGAAQAYANYGVKEAIIITAGDDNVCNDCLDLEANNPHPLMELAGQIPVHPNCYHKNTQLYTKTGWKPIKEIGSEDEVLTLNVETKEPEFQYPTGTVKHYATSLKHIHNQWFSTCVTPDHDCFVYQREKPEYRKPNELNNNSRFLRTCENNQVSPETVDINGLTLSIDDFIFLSAWFLSEGSVLHNEKVSKHKGHPVTISQYHTFLKEELTSFSDKYDIKLHVDKDGFTLYDKRLRDYFHQLGYSHEKYIPDILYNCSKEDIRKFLDYYIQGAGSWKKPNKYNSVEKLIYTSSIRMRDGLSFLILLAGYYPSISIHSETNGSKRNHLLYCLRLNKSNYAYYSSCNQEDIEYNDYVYCVEVPNHTLWTLYEGKTSWNGNCRCVIGAVIDNVNEVINEDANPVIGG